MNPFADFVFLRPLWLLAAVPALLLWWALLRRADPAQAWRGLIAPHLLPHLMSGGETRARFAPVHVLAAGWLVATVAIAGPSWKHEPAPFADDTAALAIVVKVTPSMLAGDTQPTRLARSIQKIHDLLAARGAAKTALVAYAGSAHVVMPATTDAGVVELFAQSLDPKIMPSEGDSPAAAFALADQALAAAGGGSIAWIADAVSPVEQNALARWRSASRTPVRLLAPLPAGTELDSLKAGARAAGADMIALTPDEADVRALARAAKFSPSAAGEGAARRADGGYGLVPLLFVLILPFFRRGWMPATAARRSA